MGKHKPKILTYQVALRRHPKYKEWASKVISRGKKTCLLCGKIGGRLEAHHKVPFATLLQEFHIQTLEAGLKCKALWTIKNGVALCSKCHDKIHHTKIYRTTTKPWGAEILLEVNEEYAVKQLVMWAGNKCSLQLHRKKLETFILLRGTMLFIYKDKKRRLKPGDHFTIKPNEIHRMEAVTDIVYMECSTPNLEDVTRIKDDYSR